MRHFVECLGGGTGQRQMTCRSEAESDVKTGHLRNDETLEGRTAAHESHSVGLQQLSSSGRRREPSQCPVTIMERSDVLQLYMLLRLSRKEAAT